MRNKLTDYYLKLRAKQHSPSTHRVPTLDPMTGAKKVENEELTLKN